MEKLLVFSLGCKNVQQQCKKGKSSIAHKIQLEEGVINKLENSYKYLCTFQTIEADLINTKSHLRNNYLARTKSICQSFLYSKNLINAINTLAVPVLTYAAVVMDWTQEELLEIDCQTRKILKENKVTHKNSCTERLYAKRKEGGRGLINIKCTIEQLENSTWKNIMRRSEKEKLLALTITNKRSDNVTPCQSHMDKHIVKPLHGQYVKNTEKMKNTFSWLKNPKISRQIESFCRAGTVHSNKLLCVKHYKKTN